MAPHAALIDRARDELERRRVQRHLKEECESDLLQFIRTFWPVLEPETQLIEGWPLRQLCDLMMAVADGHIKRLIINIPPGFSKSLSLNVFMVAWLWGPNDQPHLRFISASYSASLTERDNGKLVRLVTDPQYQRWWGDRFRLTKDGVGKVENSRTGWKLATSVGGTTTGERGDYVLVDDANNPQTVESDAVRETSNRWLREVLPSRLNNVREGVIINLQQRTHEADATGTLLEHGSGYAFWSIPMEYDPLRDFPLPIRWDEHGNVIEQLADPRGRDARGRRLDGLYRDLKGELKVRMGSPLAAAEGELAWPERYPEDEILKLKTILGPYAYSGQFQQAPGIRGGGIIRRDWWRLWTRDQFPELGTVIGSLDTAIKESEENDYNAMTTWGAFEGDEGEPQVILTGAWRKRCSLAELVLTVREFCVEKKVDWLLIEDKARGHDVAQELMRQFADDPWTIVLIPVNGRGAFSGDKVARLQAVAPMFSGDVRRDPVSGIDVWSGGMVWEPGRDWSDAVISEVSSFPRGAHDDYCDTVSQALAYMRRHGVVLRRVEWDAQELERKKYRRTPSLPYAI